MSDDYKQFLEENGLTEEAMQKGLAASSYSTEPCGPVVPMKSEIAGMGCFAAELIPADEIIAPLFINQRDKVWSTAGRFTNHAHPFEANARVASDFTGKFYLVSTREIVRGEEITSDYRQVMKAMQ